MGSLSGITVVDFTRQLPGPFASRELLRLGARVVKVEPPEGDLMPEGWYRALNDGKEIVSWDARAEAAPQALTDADVVLEGFRPGVWERLAIELSPTTILCSITGYGTRGPRTQDAGHDLNYLGYSGALADTAPAMPPVQVADLAAGAQGAVIEVLSALLERERSGHGARIVVSMTHSTHRFVAHRLAGDPVPRLLTGGRRVLPDLRDRRRPASDGRGARAEVLAQPLHADRAPDLVERAYEPELPELAELFRSQTLHDWRTLLEGKDTCVGPVLTLVEAADELT